MLKQMMKEKLYHLTIKIILNMKRLLQKATGKSNLVQKIVSLFLLKSQELGNDLNEHIISKVVQELSKRY